MKIEELERVIYENIEDLLQDCVGQAKYYPNEPILNLFDCKELAKRLLPIFKSYARSLVPKKGFPGHRDLSDGWDACREEMLRRIETEEVRNMKSKLSYRTVDYINSKGKKVKIVKFTEKDVKAFLDTLIMHWRNRLGEVQKGIADRNGNVFDENLCRSYIDAYQSVRISLFGELLEKDEGGDKNV
jgi:hypothetical protein